MRKIIFVLLLAGGHSLVLAQDQKLSITMDNQPISMLFRAIEAQCGYRFVFSNEIVADTIKVSVEVNNSSPLDMLSKVLPGKNLYHQLISERLIAIGRHVPAEKATASIFRATFNGFISDPKGNGVPFASVAILDGDRVRNGAISNDRGAYQLVLDLAPQTQYRLKVSSVGYKPLEVDFVYPDTASIKVLKLTEDRTTLKTLNVIGTKPLLERKTDRFIVNVEDSFLSNGLNGLEVLQKSPGIWVDNDGSIKIRGNQSVMVMINDVVQRMSGTDLSDYLKTLRSEEISKIEIISSPPSEFEAAGSGGIIHIILKKARRDGLAGNINSNYRKVEKRSAYGAGLNLNYKIKNLYLFGNIGANKDFSDYIASYEISYPNQEFYTSHTDRYNNNGALRYLFGGALDLGKNQSIGIQTVGTESKMNQYFDTYIDFNGAQPLTGHARSYWYRRPSLNSSTLNYVWKIDSLGSTFKIIGDYVRSTRTELNNFSSQYTLATKNSTFRNNTPNTTNLYSMQADYIKNVKGNLSFRAGLKFVSTKRESEVVNENLIGTDWVLNTNLSNRFIYQEDLSMAYASIEKGWKKFSIKGGLRAEYTFMNGNSVTANQKFKRDYLGLFPSIFINRKLNEEKGSAVYLSYSRRLQRPSFADLNPYRLQFDNYLTQLGNPDLKPEYTHKFTGGILFWKNWSAELYFARTVDKVAQLANPVANNIIEYQNRNFNSSNEYGFSLFAPVSFFKWWTMNTSLSAFNLKYSLGTFEIDQSSLTVTMQHAFLYRDFNVDVSTYYRSPSVSAVTHYAAMFSTDLAIGKKIFHKTIQVRGFITDVFNTFREKDFTEYLGTKIDFYQKRPTRTMGISLNYSFSCGKKFSNKKIEQSNEDEKRRIGN